MMTVSINFSQIGPQSFSPDFGLGPADLTPKALNNWKAGSPYAEGVKQLESRQTLRRRR
jgi:hypothetical protein